MAVAEMFGEACPASAPFFGYMGAAAALIFASKFPGRIFGTRSAVLLLAASARGAWRVQDLRDPGYQVNLAAAVRAACSVLYRLSCRPQYPAANVGRGFSARRTAPRTNLGSNVKW